MKNLIQKWNSINLIKRIICGLIVGIILGLAIPQASVISILGDLFVGALRGIAPLLVFFSFFKNSVYSPGSQMPDSSPSRVYAFLKLPLLFLKKGVYISSPCLRIRSYEESPSLS